MFFFLIYQIFYHIKYKNEKRNFALKINSGKFQSTCWISLGIIMAIIGVIILCLLGLNNEIPFTSQQIENGIVIHEETKYIKSFIISLPFFGWAFLITPLVILFIRLVVPVEPDDMVASYTDFYTTDMTSLIREGHIKIVA